MSPEPSRLRSSAEVRPLWRDPPLASGNLFVRALAARVIASTRHEHIGTVVAREWPNDRILAQVVRAVSAPALTTVSGWASELVRRLVLDGLDAMGSAYAGPQVLKSALVLSLGDGAGSISVPGFVASSSNASFVAEGQPIPVRQLAGAATVLQGYKIGVISALSREMADGSNAEAIIGNTLGLSAGAAIDAALFDASAATTARPAGLRNGIAALTASASTDLWEAAFEDITALINSVAPVGGNGPYILVASPGRARSMRLRFDNSELTVFGSGAVGNDLLAIAPAALAAALSPEPQVETSGMATLHMDSAPAAIVGTAGAVAAEARSLFQTDSIAVKIRWPVTWGLRDVRGVAWVTPTWK